MQYARPISDVENPGGWASAPLWEKLDEEPFDDGDYVESPKSAAGDSFTIGLSGVTDPEVHTGHIIRIRAKTAVTGTFKYELMQGVVVIKDSGDVVLGTSEAEYNMMLTEEEAGNISDYLALRMRVTAVITQKNQRQNVSWIRVDVPDAAVNEFVYGGDVPVSILPDAPKASLSKSYSGDIPVSVLPGYSSARIMVYAGAVPLTVLPEAPIAPLEKSYAGDISLVLLPSSVYELTGAEINEFVYAGNIPLSALPSYVSILERVYQGAVELSILPSFPEAPLEKSYFGNLPLLIMPDCPQASLEKDYAGDVGIVLMPTAGYSLKGLLEFVYGGDIPLSIVSGHSSVVDMIYGGDIGLAVIPTSAYGLEAFIEVVKTVFLKSKLTERLVELKSKIKPSIVLNSEIKPEGEN